MSIYVSMVVAYCYYLILEHGGMSSRVVLPQLFIYLHFIPTVILSFVLIDLAVYFASLGGLPTGNY